MTVWKPEGSSQCRLNTRPTAARLAWFSVRCPLPSEEPLIFGHEPSSRVIFKGTSGQPLQPNNKYAGRHTRPRRGLGGAQLCPQLPRWTRPKQPQRAPAAGPGAHARMRICANSGALAPRDPAIRGHRYQAAPGDGASAAVARDGGRAHCPLWVVQQGHDGCDQFGIDHRLYTNKRIVSGLWSGRYSVERFICPEAISQE